MGVLTPVDVNRSETDHKACNAFVKSTGKKAFDDVCANRVGELFDDDEDDDLIQWTFDDFTFIKKLGSGGSASVFEAKEKKSGYRVALKIQPDDEDAICELDIHQPLDHKNIVQVIDYFFSEETFGPKVDQAFDEESSAEKRSRNLIMILEVCEGGSLFDVIRDNKNGYVEDEEQAAKLFWNAVNAMEYIHNQGIIHCDVKSLNFLVNNAGTLKICDFGMSVKDSEREIIGGSPVYMSPEHLMAWRHMSDNFDNRVDIYSMGVILFEILVGYSPYQVLDNQDQSEEDEDDDDSLLANFGNLDIQGTEDGDSFEPPILDLRKLDDQSEEEPFYMPPPIFPDFVSPEAQDLILSLMEPSCDKRISLVEVKKHPWIQKNIAEA